MRREARLAVLERCAVLVLGIYLAGVGINILTRGDVIYLNLLRWPVAAPISLIIGVVLIAVSFKLHREPS